MRLLVIEDNSRIASAIKRSLQQVNFAVDIVTDGDSGLMAALDPDYDLIILDWMLPGSLDGPAICQIIREKNITIPVLMLSAKGEVQDRITGLKIGADDYLTKPFSMEELITRVQVLLRRPNKISGPEISVADLVVNLESFQVHRGTENIKLSSREFRLLSYLVTNHGLVLSKDTIINHVWDGDSYVLPNTIEVYIGYLRAKIDRPFKDKPSLIHTVHGFGYRLGE